MRWVLLRGLTRESGHWGDFPQQLSDAMGPGHEVVPLDLPGNGARHLARSPASIEALTQACRDQLTIGRPSVLVAMSLGAMVALEWARVAPQALAGAVLINTSAGGHSPWWQRLAPRNYPTLARIAMGGMAVAERERRVLAMTSSDPQRHAGIVREWARLAQERPVSRGNAVRQLIAAASYRAPASKPGVPVLLLASAGDRLVSCACSQRLAQQWGVPFSLHPTAGHDLPLDDPAWLLQEIRAWTRPSARPPTR